MDDKNGMTPEKSGSGLAGRRVLIIEDEPLVTMLLEDTLAEIGCEIAGLASAFPDAMAKATSLSFDVAILDLNLNGKHSFPIAEALLDRGIPFVLETGYGMASLPDPLKAVPVLNKPFGRRQLEAALRAALSIKTAGEDSP